MSAYLKSNFPGILTESNGNTSYSDSYDTEHAESPSTEIEQLIEHIEVYGKTTVELAKLKALESTTVVATSIVSKIVVGITLFLFILVLTIGLAIYLGEILGKPYYGYFIIAVFYLIVGIVLFYNLNHWIKKSFGDSLIKQALNQKP